MAAIVRETQSIKEAVVLINGLDTGKFPRLLSRILQKLHLKDEHSFNEEEKEKLQAALCLEKHELRLVLETVSFILEQAAYYNVKPAALQQQLENIHLNKEKAEAFAQAWTNMGQDFIEKLRQNTFAPKKLEKIGWCLNLEMGQSTQAKMKSPHAILELGVNSEGSEASVSLVRPWICAFPGRRPGQDCMEDQQLPMLQAFPSPCIRIQKAFLWSSTIENF